MANKEETTSQEQFLRALATQAHNKAYEQALAATFNLVIAFVRAGKIDTMDQAITLLNSSHEKLTNKLETDLISMALGTVNTQQGMPGVDPNVPARA